MQLVAVAVGLVLFGRGIALRRTASKMPGQTPGPEEPQPSRHSFSLIFAAELLTIVVARIVLALANHLELFVPVTALVVGAHFLPLARMFHVGIYYVTGALLIGLAVLIPLVLPVSATFAGAQIQDWWSVVGFGAALVLWGTGLALWLRGQGLVREAQAR